MKNVVFISYHSDDEDNRYKNLLKAWSRNNNGNFKIRFNDMSVGVSINSIHGKYIRSVIKPRIGDCNRFICLIGKNTKDSSWVNWEIKTAIGFNKKIIAIKIHERYKAPVALHGHVVTWVNAFENDPIQAALNKDC